MQRWYQMDLERLWTKISSKQVAFSVLKTLKMLFTIFVKFKPVTKNLNI